MLRLIVVLGLLLVTTATAAESPSFQELEESLTCQCGCGLTVHSCNHLQCPSAIPLRQEIRAQMEKGLGKDAILQYFADKYGEKILSSPTTTGFNLTAWVVPFVMVALGTIFVMFTLLRWRRGKRRPAAPVAVPQPAGDPALSAHEKTLERELKQFDA
jgi:cytochrome c-type biogenesis protein CcmH